MLLKMLQKIILELLDRVCSDGFFTHLVTCVCGGFMLETGFSLLHIDHGLSYWTSTGGMVLVWWGISLVNYGFDKMTSLSGE